jgi:hypothetical protein
MRNSYFALVVFLVGCLSIGNVQAQDDLLNMLEEELLEEQKDVRENEIAIFKATRLILGHTTKTRKKNELELLISHRFGRLNSGSHQLWGLDNASVRIGLDYGVSDLIDVGIGRSSFDKSFDFFLKYKLISQSKGNERPVSLLLFSSMAIRTTPKDDPTYDFKERLAYTYQAVVSRKFNSKFSMQISPSYVIRNRPVDLSDEDALFAIGVGGRFQATPSLSINLETFQRINAEANSTEFNAVSLGVDIETGGHVFQLHLTNSQMTFERAFIAETTDDFFNGAIHFGFNISRTFNLKNSK